MISLPFATAAFVATHRGAHRVARVAVPAQPGTVQTLHAGGGDWEVSTTSRPIDPDRSEVTLEARVVRGQAREIAVGISFEDPHWTTANYVLIPGAVYAGNRFSSHPHDYPPPPGGPRPGEDPKNLQIIDLPRLRREAGPSHLDQLSLDAATPGLGIYFPARRKGLFLLSAQASAVGPFNFEIIENGARDRATILLGTPGIRHDAYYSIKFKEPGGYAYPSLDRTIDLLEGEAIRFSFRLHWFDCPDVQGLFDHLFAHRKDCFVERPLRDEIPFSATWDIIHRKQNAENWREPMRLYQTSILGRDEPPVSTLLFQTGWCGGMIVTYPLLQEGDARSVQRVLEHLDFCFTGLAPAGYFYPYFDGTAWTCDPGRQDPHPRVPWTLTRRVGDALYFLLRHLFLLRERGLEGQIQPAWEAGLRRNAEALASTWRTHGDLGQYINVETGAVEIVGTTSGALVPAALLLAADYFDCSALAEVAGEIAEHFRLHDLAEGITTGGPGDAMQAPDSESVAALIESFILLYEKNGDEKWLTSAHHATTQTASWALSYDYRFPEGSALALIRAQSRGAFLANAQNKTGVPGICTLSGQGLLRVYRATGDRRVIEFLREISHTIPQYMGRADKKIPCRFSGGNAFDHQPEGWICERVNVTQWGEPIGELFAYTTWCEVAMMLTWADLPGIYAEPDTGFAIALDHVKARWIPGEDDQPELEIHNPTAFDARVRILLEDAAARQRPLPINAAATWPIATVPAGKTLSWKPAQDPAPLSRK